MASSIGLLAGIGPARVEAAAGSTDAKGANRTAFARLLAPTNVRRVEPERTPISAKDARNAIARAYEVLTGQSLDATGQAILTAQWAHETGHGASMFNYNFGGIKGTGPSGLTVSQRTTEGYGANSRRIVDQFRAYETIDEGAKDYVRLLLNRYGDAVAAAGRGDASGFVHGLKQRGYFTGDPAAYERSIQSIAQNLGASFEPTGARAVSALPHSQSVPEPSALEARALLTRMHDDLGWLAAPQPTALLGVTSTDEPEPPPPFEGNFEGISVVQTLSMTDEITRSALQIAREDAERRRLVKSNG